MKRRTLALLSILIILFCLFPGVSHAKQENDLIRVLLTRFGSPSEISVNISGSYSIGSTYFQRGMTIQLSAGTGKNQILLRYEGMIIAYSGKLTLVRHQTEGENGLRLQGSTNLYTGDLTVTNRNGQLRLILSIPIEEYLLGVLPWEMSSGFPLEALKAQAVAARTYALTHRSSDRDYDVVDNTNDQVYAGISDNAPIIRKAVTATAGICVFYHNQMVTCYYTASNGGQIATIEQAWGKTDAPTGYIQAKADPYDLDNDESVVRQASIPVSPNENDWPELQSLLKSAAGKSLQKLGYSDDPDDIRIREINDIKTVTTDNIATALTFQLSIDAVRTESFSEEESSFLTNDTISTEIYDSSEDESRHFYSLSNPIEVTLKIFPELESALQLSINNSPNELWNIRKSKNAFIVEARRFGHGVGLSQRGAQRMASAYNWNYQQILHFYYHDITLKRADLAAVTPAPSVSFDFDVSPGPPPTTTPKPTLMPVTIKPDSKEKLAIVNGVATDSSLNMRSAPDTSAEILARLYYGQTLAVIEESANGWLHVRTDVLDGYVMEKFVSYVDN